MDTPLPKQHIIFAFIFISLALLPDRAKSQASLYFGVYYGSYAMKDYKAVQQRIGSQGGGLKQNFPATPGYQIEISWKGRGNRFGFYGDYAQTRSTVGSDESMIAKRYVLGLLDYASIGKNFSIGGRLGFNITTLATKGITFSGSDFGGTTDPSFYSTGFSFEPFLAWLHPSKIGDFRIAVGYELNGQGASYWSENNTIAMRTPTHKDANADWSGVRINLAYGLHLGKLR